MKKAPSYKALLRRHGKCPSELQQYFQHLPLLTKEFAYEACLAYIFLRTELAQNRTLYCGVVKLHRVDAEVAQRAIDAHHMTREGFLELYERIYGKALPSTIVTKLNHAEKVRDKVVHGKHVNDSEMREAIYDVIDYAEKMNSHMQAEAGFRPFGDLRGFKGRAIPLDKSTTRWLLKGMGFAIA